MRAVWKVRVVVVACILLMLICVVAMIYSLLTFILICIPVGLALAWSIRKEIVWRQAGFPLDFYPRDSAEGKTIAKAPCIVNPQKEAVKLMVIAHFQRKWTLRGLSKLLTEYDSMTNAKFKAFQCMRKTLEKDLRQIDERIRAAESRVNAVEEMLRIRGVPTIDSKAFALQAKTRLQSATEDRMRKNFYTATKQDSWW